jgi:hypothetical protein
MCNKSDYQFKSHLHKNPDDIIIMLLFSWLHIFIFVCESDWSVYEVCDIDILCLKSNFICSLYQYIQHNVKMYTMACRRVLSSTPLQIIDPRTLCDHVRWDPCPHSMARPRVADGGTASRYGG